VLLALVFALGAAGGCDAQVAQSTWQGSAPALDEAATHGDAPVANAPAGSVVSSRSHRLTQRTPAQVLDANVQRLAQGLKLDQEQQVKLRQILADQYAQLMKLRTESAPGTDRSGAMRAIVDRTREEIRAMLNDQQKQQYVTAVPRAASTATRADLEHWLDVRDAQRRENTEESQ
jgi:hypothetical protein